MTTKRKILAGSALAFVALSVLGLALAAVGSLGSAVCCGLLPLPAAIILGQLD